MKKNIIVLTFPLDHFGVAAATLLKDLFDGNTARVRKSAFTTLAHLAMRTKQIPPQMTCTHISVGCDSNGKNRIIFTGYALADDMESYIMETSYAAQA